MEFYIEWKVKNPDGAEQWLPNQPNPLVSPDLQTLLAHLAECDLPESALGENCTYTGVRIQEF